MKPTNPVVTADAFKGACPSCSGTGEYLKRTDVGATMHHAYDPNERAKMAPCVACDGTGKKPRSGAAGT